MSVRDRVSSYRHLMREKDYRPIQVSAPDVRTERFAAEAHRQSALVAAANGYGDDQEFIEAASARVEQD